MQEPAAEFEGTRDIERRRDRVLTLLLWAGLLAVLVAMSR